MEHFYSIQQNWWIFKQLIRCIIDNFKQHQDSTGKLCHKERNWKIVPLTNEELYKILYNLHTFSKNKRKALKKRKLLEIVSHGKIVCTQKGKEVIKGLQIMFLLIFIDV